MTVVLVTDSLHPAGVEWLQKRGARLEFLPPGRRAQLVEYSAGADALIIRTTTTITADLLAGAPRVRVVGRAGAGIDNIDVDAAAKHGVAVVSAPEANAVAAAEHTFALMLSVLRGVALADRDLKAGRWAPDAPLGQELYGQTLGIVGFGRIGQRVAQRARAFEMRVLIHDIAVNQEAAGRLEVEVIDTVEELLRASNILTVHTPLDEETRGLIDRQRIALLPTAAVVINCARGGIVDEVALREALDADALLGAGIDVFSNEPLTDFRLASHPKVVATPHWGAHTGAAKRRVGLEIAKNVWQALS